VEDGIYDPEVVQPRAMASLLLAIYIGLRFGRLLGDDFDMSGSLRSLFMMHAGRIQASVPGITMAK
jgi:hypothetical protein